MKYYLKSFIKIEIVAFFVLIIFRLGAPSKAATLVSLGLADSFAVLAGAGITNSVGPTIITGDVGSFPTLTQNGFGTVTLIGINHFGDATTQSAKDDLVTAYDAAAAQPCNVNLSGQDLGGLILTPGVYCFSTAAQLTGTLSINAQNDPNAVFIFQIGSTLTTNSASNVNLINGAQASNIFWQVGSSATLGTGTNFKGNILALSSITDNGGSIISGRFLARNDAVTLNNTTLSIATYATTHIVVIKHVINDNGGSALASAFSTTISGVTTATPTAAGAEFPGVNNILTSIGAYSVDEGAHVGYAKTLSADCSGTIVVGETKTCTITNDDLPDITPPASISNLALSGATTSSIVLTWTAPGDDTNTGTATLYDIRYSTSPIVNDADFTSASLVSGEPAPAVAGTVQSMTVTGLSANTLYYFAMKTSDEVPNISTVSNIPSLSTAVAPDIIPPAAISNLALSGATTSSIVLTWTAPGDDTNTGTATLYDIRYSTSLIVNDADFTAASLVSGEQAPAVAGSVQSMTVTGLSANTVYYFAMKTSDEVPNISTVSNIPSLSTAVAPDIIPPAAISNLALSGATTSSIVLTWTAPGDDTNTGTATLYDIRYSTSPIVTAGDFTASSLVSGEPAPAVAGTVQSMTVTGLSANTLYYFAMKTSDEVPNISTVSNIPSLSTAVAPDIIPPAAISNLALSGATTSSIVLTWTAPGDDTNTGTATLYDIRYSTSPIVTAGDFTAASLVSGEPAPAVAGTVQNMTVTGLSANTLYYFAMKTSDEVPNISTVSNIPSLSTAVAPDIIPPAAISKLALSGATTSSIVLTWTAPGDDTNTGTATLYDIRYSTSPIVNDADFTSASLVSGEPAPAVAGTVQSMTVTGLSANTVYYFAMKTSDEVPNISTVSNIPSLSTAVAPDIIPPAAISNLALSGATTSSIVLTWTAPGDDTNTGTATLYDIRYSTAPIVTAGDFTAASLVSGEPAPAVAGTVQSMTVTGLSANTVYYFAMKTSDEVPNISTVSNIPSLSTAVAPDIILPAAISNLALSGATTSSIVLTWTAPGDDTNTGTATLYDIRYATAPIVTAGDFTAASLVSGEPAPAVAGTVQNMTVTGLSAGRLYYFAMKTSDEAPNISAVSNIASLATISNISGGSVPDTTGPINSNISAASITQSSVIITWQTNEISNSLVRFGPTSAIGGTAFDEILDTKHLVPITGLTIDTTYHYTVCSTDASGNQSCSGEFTFKTLSANAPLPTYSSAEELASSLTINIDKGLSVPLTGTASCVSGTLIKLQSDGNPLTQVDSTVYYCGADGKRYVFPNPETYLSWYPDFSNIAIVSLAQLASIPVVGNVTYRPGRFLAKVQSDFKVYAIAKGGVLRWITSEAVAQSLYGLLWKNLINDIPATFFANYILGEPITPADVAPAIPAGL